MSNTQIRRGTLELEQLLVEAGVSDLACSDTTHDVASFPYGTASFKLIESIHSGALAKDTVWVSMMIEVTLRHTDNDTFPTFSVFFKRASTSTWVRDRVFDTAAGAVSYTIGYYQAKL